MRSGRLVIGRGQYAASLWTPAEFAQLLQGSSLADLCGGIRGNILRTVHVHHLVFHPACFVCLNTVLDLHGLFF